MPDLLTIEVELDFGDGVEDCEVDVDVTFRGGGGVPYTANGDGWPDDPAEWRVAEVRRYEVEEPEPETVAGRVWRAMMRRLLRLEFVRDEHYNRTHARDARRGRLTLTLEDLPHGILDSLEDGTARLPYSTEQLYERIEELLARDPDEEPDYDYPEAP